MSHVRHIVLFSLGFAAFSSSCTNGEDTTKVQPQPKGEVHWQSAPAPLRRLLSRQYVASVKYLLGVKAAAAANPPADTSLNGFMSIAASQLSLNDDLIARYELSARAVAMTAMGNTARVSELTACEPKTPSDAACLRSFVERFGRLAWRRPLIEEEITSYVALASSAAEKFSDFYTGVELVTSTMLQSPNFLYQVELGTPVSDRTDIRKLTGFEVASRMSFLLHDRTPSAELLDAAANGELDSGDGVRTWVERLLKEPETFTAARNFFAELLGLNELEHAAKDPTLFPQYSAALAASMKEETLHDIDNILWSRNEPVTNILTAPSTFVDEALAQLYATTKPTYEWQQTTLPSEQGRMGILSHASIMTQKSHPTSTSATRRGLFVMERFLCRTMPPPPPGVITQLPPSSAAPTLRDRIAVHQTDPVCSGCHKMADNIGLTFEKLDAIGRWRDRENDAVIDTRGAVEGFGSWKDPAELVTLLSKSEEVTSCLFRQLYRYGTGHVEIAPEWPAIETLLKNWTNAGLSYRALLLELVSSDLFRHVGVSP